LYSIFDDCKEERAEVLVDERVVAKFVLFSPEPVIRGEKRVFVIRELTEKNERWYNLVQFGQD
jgi:hypothetical protein